MSFGLLMFTIIEIFLIFWLQSRLITLLWLRWYALLGQYDLAVSHVLEVLACSHQAKTTQDIFLRVSLQIVQVTLVLDYILPFSFFLSLFHF